MLTQATISQPSSVLKDRSALKVVHRLMVIIRVLLGIIVLHKVLSRYLLILVTILISLVLLSNRNVQSVLIKMNTLKKNASSVQVAISVLKRV